MSSPNEIQVLDTNIADAISKLAKSLGEAVVAGRRTCVHCIYFEPYTEACTFYNPAMRPPAKVIAFGCPAFVADDVPF